MALLQGSWRVQRCACAIAEGSQLLCDVVFGVPGPQDTCFAKLLKGLADVGKCLDLPVGGAMVRSNHVQTRFYKVWKTRWEQYELVDAW